MKAKSKATFSLSATKPDGNPRKHSSYDDRSDRISFSSLVISRKKKNHMREDDNLKRERHLDRIFKIFVSFCLVGSSVTFVFTQLANTEYSNYKMNIFYMFRFSIYN